MDLSYTPILNPFTGGFNNCDVLKKVLSLIYERFYKMLGIREYLVEGLSDCHEDFPGILSMVAQ